VCSGEVKGIIKKGGMPLARLRLRHHTGGGGKILNWLVETVKPLVPQFPLAEPAYSLASSPTAPIKPKGSKIHLYFRSLNPLA